VITEAWELQSPLQGRGAVTVVAKAEWQAVTLRVVRAKVQEFQGVCCDAAKEAEAAERT